MTPSAKWIAAGAILALSGPAVLAAPFLSTDQNPFLAGFAISAPALLELERGTTASASLNWSSTALIQRSGTDLLTVDAETREWRIQIERAMGQSVVARLHIPYRTTGAGSLDGAIEGWHDFFGLPNGARSSLPRDRFRIDYRRGTASILSRQDTSFSGIGDLQFDIGVQLRNSESSATSLWSTVTLPTGDPDKFTGAGGIAGSAAIAHTQRLGSLELFGHVGAVVGGSWDILADQRRSAIGFAMIGVDYRATQHTTLTLQVDAHSAAFDDRGLDFLGPAYILTVGGGYTFSSGWRLQLGVAEDIKVEASPDVSFVMNLRKQW